MNTIRLSNGVFIPVLGFGPMIAGYSRQSSVATDSLLKRGVHKIFLRPIGNQNYIADVARALAMGYTLLDYSASYGDGSLIRRAIKKSGCKRADLFLTTRISAPAQLKNSVENEFFTHLKNLGTDYVDLLMFHWPVTGCYIDTWLKMIELYKKGYCRAIGVANCHQHHLEALKNASDFIPQVNQFEMHPLFTQKKLLSFCKERNIIVEAYTPIARFDDRLVRLPKLRTIAQKYNKSVSQIVLRWHIENGVIPVVRALNKSHQRENIEIFDFSLTKEEIQMIDSLNINARLRFDPDNCDFSIL